MVSKVFPLWVTIYLPDPDNEYLIVFDELGLLLNTFRGFKLLTLTL